MEENKEKLLEEYHARQHKQKIVGTIAVYVIGIVTILFSVSQIVFASNSAIDLLIAFVKIIVATLLLCKLSWPRIVLAVMNSWNAIWSFFTVVITIPEKTIIGDIPGELSWLLFVESAVVFAWYLASALLLFFSKGVKEYANNI